ncbi:MAG: hypothetical protein KDB01_00175 [Planctomycetaceae bacterium]|nr:hypothetical protein [Planctomycetaceae bacterium]
MWWQAIKLTSGMRQPDGTVTRYWKTHAASPGELKPVNSNSAAYNLAVKRCRGEVDGNHESLAH